MIRKIWGQGGCSLLIGYDLQVQFHNSWMDKNGFVHLIDYIRFLGFSFCRLFVPFTFLALLSVLVYFIYCLYFYFTP